MASGSTSFNGFDRWLQNVSDAFKILSSEERVSTIHTLTDLCSPNERMLLTKASQPDVIGYNFMERLPPELVAYIIHMFDDKSLLIASAVCQSWRNIVLTCASRWRIACVNIGASDGSLNSDNGITDYLYYSHLYRKILRSLHLFRNGQGLTCRTFSNDHKISSMYIHDNKLGICSSQSQMCSELSIIDVEAMRKIFTTEIDYRSKVILFNDSSVLYNGSGGTLVVCDSPHGAENILSIKHRYIGHQEPIEWMDYIESMEIMITASNDGYVRIWSAHEPYVRLECIAIHDDDQFYIDVCGMLHKKEKCYTLAVHDCTGSTHVVYIKSEPCLDNGKESFKLCFTVSQVVLQSCEDSFPLMCFTSNGNLAFYNEDHPKSQISVYKFNFPIPDCGLTFIRCGSRLKCTEIHKHGENYHQLVNKHLFSPIKNAQKMLGCGDKYALLFLYSDDIADIFLCLVPLFSKSKPIYLPVNDLKTDLNYQKTELYWRSCPQYFVIKKVCDQNLLDGLDNMFNNQMFFGTTGNGTDIQLYSFNI